MRYSLCAVAPAIFKAAEQLMRIGLFWVAFNILAKILEGLGFFALRPIGIHKKCQSFGNRQCFNGVGLIFNFRALIVNDLACLALNNIQLPLPK